MNTFNILAIEMFDKENQACRLPFRKSRVCPRPGHTTLIVHEIISRAILLLPLIQVRYLSVTGERMCTFVLVNRLGGLSLPRKIVRLADRLDMTFIVLTGP